MNRKLELKHLAPYLPYELKAATLVGIFNYKPAIRKVVLDHFTYDLDTVGLNHILQTGTLILPHKPILRPLSDIKNYVDEDTYEIQEFREYVGIGDWCAIYDNAIEYICDNINNLQDLNIGALPSALVEWMATKNLDFNKLIPDGLAIDKNTL